MSSIHVRKYTFNMHSDEVGSSHEANCVIENCYTANTESVKFSALLYSALLDTD